LLRSEATLRLRKKHWYRTGLEKGKNREEKCGKVALLHV